MWKKNRVAARFTSGRHSCQNQENMVRSAVSDNRIRETNPLVANGIEGLESQQEKQPSENNHDLELTLACGGFPVTPTPQNNISKKTVHQPNKNDGLDLGLGTLLGLDTSPLIKALGRDISIECIIRCSRTTYGSIALLNRSFCELIKSGEIYKLRQNNNVIEYWVYFSCHYAKWEAFDPSTRKWMQLPMIDVDHCLICFQFSDKEPMAVGNKLLVLSRDLTGHATTYIYSLLTNSWSLGQTMNEPRCLFGSASLGQTAIFAGGVNHIGNIVDTVELYDSKSGNWETLPSMIKPRKMCSAVYMDGKVYVIGGVGDGIESLTCGEEYDLDAKMWTEIPNMSPVDALGGRVAPPLVAVVGNELYAADSAEMKVKKYDKSRKQWAVIGTLPERAQAVNGWGMAFRGCGERIILIGGPRGGQSNVVEIYSWIPSEGPPEWSVIGQKRSDSFVFNCAVMGC